jgi:two-component system, response regulator YesN
VKAATSEMTQFRVREALACMKRSYQDPQICLSSVATQVGISPCYLSRILALQTGRHFREHIRRIRLQHAAELLKNAALSVKEISWTVGYVYATSFDRDFRTQYGKSPVEFRCQRTRASA